MGLRSEEVRREVCTHTLTRVREVRTHARTHARMHTHIHVHACVQVCVCICVYVCVSFGMPGEARNRDHSSKYTPVVNEKFGIALEAIIDGDLRKEVPGSS